MEEATGSGAGDWLRAAGMETPARTSIARAEIGAERWRIIGRGPERTPDPTHFYTAEAKLAGGIDEAYWPFFLPLFSLLISTPSRSNPMASSMIAVASLPLFTTSIAFPILLMAA